MFTTPTSTPNRKNSDDKNYIPDYGSSRLMTGRTPTPPPSSAYSNTNSPIGKRSETAFSDADFSFDFDAVSESSNDVLATIDEGAVVRLEADNVSALYNNAADARSNKKASIFAHATSESSSHIILNKRRLVFVLSPALAVEFARTFTGLFMLLSLNSFLGYNIGDVSLVISGVLGVCIIQFVAFRLRTLKTSTFGNSPDKRNILVRYFIAYQMVFILSVALIVIMCWRIVDFEYHDDTRNSSMTLNSSSFEPEQHIVTASTTAKAISVVLSTFLTTGYILVTSITVSGQYILSSFISHLDSKVLQENASPVIIVWSAVGGTLAGLTGILDTVSNWCPRDDCLHHTIAHAAIFSSIACSLSLICFIASLSAIYWDVIREVWERIVLYQKTHFFIDPNHKDSRHSDKLQQRDITAQEEFDECVGLLEASGHSFSSSHFTGHSMGSQNDLLGVEEGADASGILSSPNVKMYAHQIPVAVPTLKKMLTRKPYISVVLLVLFLSCWSAIFQFYTPEYLSETVFSYRVAHRSNRSSITAADDLGYTQSIGQDSSNGAGLKLASAGTFLYSLVFLVTFVKRKWILNSISPRLKPWFFPFLLLAMSVFAITLVATDAGQVYVVTAFIYGTVRMAEAEMLHTVTRRVDQSWPVVDHDVTTTPKSFIWSLVPLSLVASSLLATPLTVSSSHYNSDHHAPMVCVAVIGLILALGFGISRRTVHVF